MTTETQLTATLESVIIDLIASLEGAQFYVDRCKLIKILDNAADKIGQEEAKIHAKYKKSEIDKNENQ
jgi:hypothetical protein